MIRVSVCENKPVTARILQTVRAIPVHLQEKQAIPCDTEQTLLPDNGFDGLSLVIVGKIPPDYGKVIQNEETGVLSVR